MIFTIIMLTVTMLHVFGTCDDGDEWVFSENTIEATRCSDDKLFIYTQRYGNETHCTSSNTVDEGLCWWDTSVQSHCLQSEECVWLDDIIDQGICYCAVTTDCAECNGETPSPTVDVATSECPTDCKVYYLGCVGMYCNCLGECASPQEMGCFDAVNPRCYVYYTNNPTRQPTPLPTSLYVYWGTSVCCIAESDIAQTSSSVAVGLNLEYYQVSVSSYTLSMDNTRRRVDSLEAWNITYAIMVDEFSEKEVISTNLWDDSVVADVQDAIEADLQVELELFVTITTSDTLLPTAAPTGAAKTSDSTGLGMIVGVVVGLLVIVIVMFLLYRFWWTKREGFFANTVTMTTAGLHPVGTDETPGFDKEGVEGWQNNL